MSFIEKKNYFQLCFDASKHLLTESGKSSKSGHTFSTAYTYKQTLALSDIDSAEWIDENRSFIPKWSKLGPKIAAIVQILAGNKFCHTWIQLGIQLELNSCKYHLASWVTKWHDYGPDDHPPARLLKTCEKLLQRCL